MCRTKIEKVSGCNHMTCLFCGYDFCWFCGGDASHGSGHWTGFGCGASMMNDAPPPSTQIGRVLKKLAWVVLFIILFPIFLVLFVPVSLTIGFITVGCKNSCLCGLINFVLSPLAFAFGLVLDICFIPIAIGVVIY